MRPIRYVGRHRNAGFGYSRWERCRREVAFWCARRGLVRLGYLIDFDRDRYALGGHEEWDPEDTGLQDIAEPWDGDDDGFVEWYLADLDHDQEDDLAGGAGSPRI